MPRSSEEMAKDLEIIDQMAEALDRVEEEVASTVVPAPTITAAPSPSGTNAPASVPSSDPLRTEEEVAEGPRQPIMPATGDILESLSKSVSLIIDGAQAAIIRAGIHENAEQLGPLSLVLGTLKKAREQADQLLGQKNE